MIRDSVIQEDYDDEYILSIHSNDFSNQSSLDYNFSDSYGSSQSEPSTSLDYSISMDSSPSGSPQKKNVGSRKRKNFTPQRSSFLNDPTFRGVTITMENRLVDSEWKLVINSTFSLSPRKKRKFKEYVESSEEEEINCSPVHEEKHCASCSAKKTPLWRDAEDGTPLCNACGIRYKKYKMRCGSCWHIPKKDEFHPRCRSCGSSYEYVSQRF